VDIGDVDLERVCSLTPPLGGEDGRGSDQLGSS